MKILGTMLILTLFTATMLTPPAHAEVQRTPGCHNFFTGSTSRVRSDGMSGWVDVTTQIYARQCLGSTTGNRWVDPIHVEFSYNREGTHESCGFWDAFEGVRYHLYLKDGAGRNYDLPTVVLPCDPSTTSFDIKSLRNAPNFTVCGIAPQWKTNYTVKIDNYNDSSGSHHGTLWDFHGPVADQC